MLTVSPHLQQGIVVSETAISRAGTVQQLSLIHIFNSMNFVGVDDDTLGFYRDVYEYYETYIALVANNII